MTKSKPTRGIDHVGITVPDLEAASRFFAEAFDAVPMYDNITRDQPPKAGPDTERTLGLEPGGVLVTMRMLQLANGPGIELFEMRAPHQQPPARPSDWGLQHFALYVDDIEAATARFEKAGGTLLTGPQEMLGVEKGPGNRFCYGRAPWGTIIELLTSPGAEEYEKQTPLRRWKPAA